MCFEISPNKARLLASACLLESPAFQICNECNDHDQGQDLPLVFVGSISSLPAGKLNEQEHLAVWDLESPLCHVGKGAALPNSQEKGTR